MPGALHCRLCCRHSKQRAVPSPICCLFVSVFVRRDRPPIFGPMPLLQLPLTLHRVFSKLLVGQAVLLSSKDAADLCQLVPPSEMAAYLCQWLAPSEMAAYSCQELAPSELAAHLI